ncbi:MAG: hypothetical protein WBA12_10300 [Catalinimonas sp.]
MGWENVRKNFSAQYHIDYEGLRFVAEKRPDHPHHVYHYDKRMRLLDTAALRNVLGTDAPDHDAYKRFEKESDLDQLPGEDVFGTGDAGIARLVSKLGTERGLRPDQADWLVGFVDECFQGFGYNHYSEDGVICNLQDQDLTPENQKRYLDPAVEAKMLRYNRDLTNRNHYVVQFHDDVLDYRRDLAPLFMSALVYKK